MYIHRMIAVIDYNSEEYRYNIYTQHGDMETAYNDLLTVLNNKASDFKIIHVATKEQDEKTSEFLDNFLK